MENRCDSYGTLKYSLTYTKKYLQNKIKQNNEQNKQLKQQIEDINIKLMEYANEPTS